MSRIGKLPIPIPSNVTVTLKNEAVSVKGPKGELTVCHFERVKVTQQEGKLHVERPEDDRQSRMYHGLYQRLIGNCVTGVSEGFRKELEISGVGYRAALQGKDLSLSLGYSHPLVITPPSGISFQVPKPTTIIIEGIDKQAVGQVAANIRRLRPVEPYKLKGVKYVGEQVTKKAGKSAKK